jgi:SAM-dependent methyltransferase
MDRQEARKIFTSIGWGHTHHCDHVFEFTMQAVEEAKGGVLLDAGAGHQACKPFFSESLYLAQEHPASGAEAKQLKEYDILCDAKVIPLKDQSVRVIFSNVSLEHMRYPEPFFRESFRVLEPGGALYINVPFVYMEHEQPYDFQRPTSFGLKRWYEDAGFERVEIHPSSSSIYTCLWALKIAIQEELDRGFDSKLKTYEARLVSECVKKLSPRIGSLFDRAPLSTCQFPIGWTARAYKRGQRTQRPMLPKAEFLRQYAIPGAHFSGDSLVM